MSKRRLAAYIFILLTSIIWGVAGPVIKYTLEFFPPVIFLTYRFFLSSVLAAVILPREKEWITSKKGSLLLLIILWAFINSTVRLGSLFVGFDQTTSLAGTMIAAMNPVFMSIVGYLFLSERVTKRERIGMAIALIGTLITVVEPVFAAESTTLVSSLTGNLIVFGSLFVDVLAVYMMKIILRKRVSPTFLGNFTFIIGFVTFITIALYFYSWQQIFAAIANAPLSAHAGVWFMAFISGSLAYTLHGKGLKTIEMGEASVFSYLSPIWAAPLSLLWLGEKISGLFILAAVVIAIGVGIAEYKKSNKR